MHALREVIAEAAPNPAHGWIKVHSEEMELMWGMTSCYALGSPARRKVCSAGSPLVFAPVAHARGSEAGTGRGAPPLRPLGRLLGPR